MKLALVVCALAAVASAMHSRRELEAIRRAAAERRSAARDVRLVERATSVQPPAASIEFSNPAAAKFFVDGNSLPDVDFDAGPSWSGLMPISAAKNETRKLFFWFFPSTQPTDDLIFWTNGGPGCSSLEGFLQENGPISWPWGTAKPIRNQWSWTNLSHVLWVEQPVGTGFSQGTPNISDDDELAAQVAGFLTQFLSIFSELKTKNLYVAGESYAGFYVPYIANYLYEHPGTVDLSLKGIWITDPSLSWDLVQEYIPAYNFVQTHADVFAFSQAFMAQLKNMSDSCGFTDYTATFATYPPKGPLPLPAGTFTGLPNAANISSSCATWDLIASEAFLVNPNFNFYRILDVWPVLWDVLGFPGSFENVQSPLYFNRTDVQDAIHAPHVSWQECTNENVYVNGTDNSIPSTLSVLPNVIEKSERVVIAHGLVDFILLSEGTRIAIQNMTWEGKQGFQTPIAPDSFSIEGFGVLGTAHTERKLTYVEINLSGHMSPQFSPWSAYKTLAFLLGKIPDLTSTALDGNLYPDDAELFGEAAGPASQRSRVEL